MDKVLNELSTGLNFMNLSNTVKTVFRNYSINKYLLKNDYNKYEYNYDNLIKNLDFL